MDNVWLRIKNKALAYTQRHIEEFKALPPDYFEKEIERLKREGENGQ